MIKHIGISPLVERQLRLLDKSAKKGAIAIATYRRIIDALLAGDFNANIIQAKRTKNGEQRIKNCIKYDLGCGYRLVSIKYGNTIFLPFLGSHDEVDLWFTTKSDVVRYIHRNEYHLETVQYSQSSAFNGNGKELTEAVNTKASISFENNSDPYEEKILEEINDSVLRKIFCGLVTSAKD